MESYDVIVIGGGISGGLPSAAYLQKAGLDVLLVEANAEVGVFCPTHETWPETLDSPHAAINFCGNSPVMEDLDLAGNSIHPGLPGTMAGGYLAAAVICEDLGLHRWWPAPPTGQG